MVVKKLKMAGVTKIEINESTAEQAQPLQAEINPKIKQRLQGL